MHNTQGFPPDASLPLFDLKQKTIKNTEQSFLKAAEINFSENCC